MSVLAMAWRRLRRRDESSGTTITPVPRPATTATLAPFDIQPDDPILAFFQTAPGAVDLDALPLDSAARDAMRAAGIKLVVPLVSQGELIGLLNLGARLSEQDYSSGDRKLLERLADQAAPAVRVAQLVRDQEAAARDRERIEQELRVARLIQQNLLPKEVPELPGWEVAAHYRPAREVGGDFYDFIPLPAGRLGIVIGDVTDKGVPAALVMAATRSVLRAVAPHLESPGQVLARVNELVLPDTPPNMFITCLYAVLDPATGRLRYANAGHDVAYIGTAPGVTEIRARGMPLGLMPDMTYEEKEAYLDPGNFAVFYSDGLVEAHNEDREMFGFPRLKQFIAEHSGGAGIVDDLLMAMDTFTGGRWEQEDDVTLVTLKRAAVTADDDVRVLADFSLPSVPGGERLAISRVEDAVRVLGLPPKRIERLKTAVAEATMNAIEHGNRNQPDVPVLVRVQVSKRRLTVRITDQGDGRIRPQVETPDIEAKLAGTQNARGWGLFLIERMVDEMRVSGDENHHVIELTLNLEGNLDGTDPLRG